MYLSSLAPIHVGELMRTTKVYTFLQLLVAALFLLYSVLCNAKEPIKVAFVMAHADQRTSFNALMREFERLNPEVDVDVIAAKPLNYIERVYGWLQEGKGPDVIWWYSGSHLLKFDENAWVSDLTRVWLENDLSLEYPSNVVDAVKNNGRMLGVPSSYYHWAILYRKSIFADHNIDVPNTWGEYINSCKVLRKKGIDLFSIGTKTSWAILGWFDYLNLRINGIEFYDAMARGEIPFTDPRIVNVLNTWFQLLNNQCFNPNHKQYDITQAFPRVYHKLSAMILAAGFEDDAFPKAIEDDFGILSFPVIDSSLPLYEVAPVDLFFVPNYVKMDERIEKILAFIASEKFQLGFNSSSNMIPANTIALKQKDEKIQKNAQIISNAKGSIQYFDRETRPSFALKVERILVDFMTNKNVELTVTSLEAARKQCFSDVIIRDFQHAKNLQ